MDGLGGFWTAAGEAARLARFPRRDIMFRVYPAAHRPSGQAGRPFRRPATPAWDSWARVESLLNLPALQAVLEGVSGLPDGSPGSTFS